MCLCVWLQHASGWSWLEVRNREKIHVILGQDPLLPANADAASCSGTINPIETAPTHIPPEKHNYLIILYFQMRAALPNTS